MKSFLAYKFTYASCGSSYIGETCGHFETRIGEHIKKDDKSHIFKQLPSTTTCFDSHNPLSFKIIDKTNSKFELKIKEALHINWTKPNLNAQQNQLALIIACATTLFLVCFGFYFIFLFRLLFSLSLTLIIGIFYYVNYILLLLHLIITHLVNTFYNSYVNNKSPGKLLWFI